MSVVDLMGVRFDYPEDQMQSKRWLGNGPYRCMAKPFAWNILMMFGKTKYN